MARLGFVGVGMMGHGMASNLMKAGHTLRLWAHSNRKPVEDLVQRGASEVNDLAALPLGLDAIFICVATSSQVERVVAEMEPSLQSGQILIETGTSDPGSTARLAERLAARGVHLVDAPMGGGAQQAAAGELASLVGGSAEDYRTVEPWVKAYSRICVHIGPVGAGHRAKLLNNLLALGQAALVIEAYRIARAEGLDWAKLYEVNMGGAARSGSLERIMVPALNGDFQGYLFTVENAVKDLGYYVDFAKASNGSGELGEAMRAFFERAAESGEGKRMMSELLRPGGS